MITKAISFADQMVTDYMFGGIVDIGTKVAERFTPSLCPVSSDMQKTIIGWVENLGGKDVKNYSTIRWGSSGSLFEYFTTAKMLFARNLHAFILSTSTGKDLVERIVKDMATTAEGLSDDPFLHGAFKDKVRDLLTPQLNPRNHKGLTYTNLGIYLAGTGVKHIGAGLIRWSMFHYLIGGNLPNIPNLYETAAVVAFVVWTLPMVETARKDLSSLKGPKIDIENLFDDAMKKTIVTEAETVFVKDSNDPPLKEFSEKVSKYKAPAQASWPYKHVKIKDKVLPAQKAVVAKATTVVSDGSELSKEAALKERERLNQAVKALPEGSIERKEAAIAAKNFSIEHAEVLGIDQKGIQERETGIGRLFREVCKMKTVEAAKPTEPVRLPKAEMSDEDE